MFRISCRPAPCRDGDGEDDLADVVPFHSLGNVPAAAHNAHALQNAAVLGGVVVDETGHPAVEMTADGVFPDQLPPGLAAPMIITFSVPFWLPGTRLRRYRTPR